MDERKIIYLDDAIDAAVKGADEYYKDSIIEELMNVSPAQPEPAIPLQWIEAEIKWLKSLDNAFATSRAKHISAMVNIWKDKQDE